MENKEVRMLWEPIRKWIVGHYGIKMYLMRTKKQLEQEENKELQEKRERLLEKQFAEVGRAPDTAAAANAGKSPTKKDVQSNQKEFKIDDLPDGACFRPKSVLQSEGKGETAIKPVEVSYIIIACGYF